MDGFAISHQGKCYVQYHNNFLSLFSCLRQDVSIVKICNGPFFRHLMPMLWHQPYIICMVSQPFSRGGSVSLIRSKILPKNQAHVICSSCRITEITVTTLYGALVSMYMYCSLVLYQMVYRQSSGLSAFTINCTSFSDVINSNISAICARRSSSHMHE